jgi:hypothetical protein
LKAPLEGGHRTCMHWHQTDGLSYEISFAKTHKCMTPSCRQQLHVVCRAHLICDTEMPASVHLDALQSARAVLNLLDHFLSCCGPRHSLEAGMAAPLPTCTRVAQWRWPSSECLKAPPLVPVASTMQGGPRPCSHVTCVSTSLRCLSNVFCNTPCRLTMTTYSRASM